MMGVEREGMKRNSNSLGRTWVLLCREDPEKRINLC